MDEPSGTGVRRQESKESFRSSRHRGIGFIMFECGLEEIKATAVRRLGFKVIPGVTGSRTYFC